MDTTQMTVTSKDGTAIAFEQSGAGPVMILVAAALSDRADTAKLAGLLTENFTVINYDRRGRGKSTDTLPFAVEREVEDIEALIDAGGGSASLFGSSSGSVLALEAASKLGKKVEGLIMYEPPFIIDNTRPPISGGLAQEIDRLVSSSGRNEAVKLFFTKAVGIPPIFVTLMRLLMPGWSKMAGMAHTISYDLAVLAGTQEGKPLPAMRWATANAPTMVLVGGKSPTFFHTGAKALTGLLPNAKYRALPGRNHSAVVMAPKDIAVAAVKFLCHNRSQTKVTNL
jgi:pimeloyl-ACP methyl ester carboxylesterase